MTIGWTVKKRMRGLQQRVCGSDSFMFPFVMPFVIRTVNLPRVQSMNQVASQYLSVYTCENHQICDTSRTFFLVRTKSKRKQNHKAACEMEDVPSALGV